MTYDIGCEVVGSRGSLTLAAPALTHDWTERFHGAYRAQYAAWLQAVDPQSATGPSAYDGYANNAVTDAALAALASGRAQPVRQETENTAGVTP
jgi:myo-inositol 2-dehydrogenase/D-chiro-inositol 1-dehydrogenase